MANRTAALRQRAERLGARAQAERKRHGSVDAVFEMVDRDGEVAGGIMAGALAYRLFIWLLPFALVVVAGLGIAADASDRSPQDTAGSLGLKGVVSSSVASAAKGSGRWYALGVGIPILVYATRSVLRALIGAHRLVWADARTAVSKATFAGSLRLLGLLLFIPVLTALASAARAWSTGPGVLVTLAVLVPYAGVWLLITLRLPHRDAHWTALIPGALLFAVGAEVIHAVAAYLLAPYAIAKQGTYGALGLAAAILLALFVLSRLMIAAAVVNATLWERRQ